MPGAKLFPWTGFYAACAARSYSAALPIAKTAPLCGMCRRAEPRFRRAVAYGAYEGALRDLVHLFKYQKIKPAGKLLGSLLNQAASTMALPDSLIVVPVPLWSGKRQARGFNQAEAIAQSFFELSATAASNWIHLFWSAHGKRPRRRGLPGTSAVPMFAALLPS